MRQTSRGGLVDPGVIDLALCGCTARHDAPRGPRWARMDSGALLHTSKKYARRGIVVAERLIAGVREGSGCGPSTIRPFDKLRVFDRLRVFDKRRVRAGAVPQRHRC